MPAMDMEHLASMLNAAGMQLAQTDPEKLAQAERLAAAQSASQPRGRARPPRVAIEDAPLVQVETKNDPA